MKTLDISQLMSENNMTLSKANEMIRLRLKNGEIWSRLNPGLLSGAELLPYISVNSPPHSAAELTPFPVAARDYENFDPARQDPLDFFAEEKIRWCARQGQKAGSAIANSAKKQLDYYDLLRPVKGSLYYWIDLDPQTAPYRPLLDTILPALENYCSKDPVLPQPPLDRPGESWHTPNPDSYGVSMHFSGTVDDNEHFVLAVSLSRQTVFWLRNYVLDFDRYTFIRQQIFYLIGLRLEPWLAGGLSKKTFRGMIYRKPKK